MKETTCSSGPLAQRLLVLAPARTRLELRKRPKRSMNRQVHTHFGCVSLQAHDEFEFGDVFQIVPHFSGTCGLPPGHSM